MAAPKKTIYKTVTVKKTGHGLTWEIDVRATREGRDGWRVESILPAEEKTSARIQFVKEV